MGCSRMRTHFIQWREDISQVPDSRGCGSGCPGRRSRRTAPVRDAVKPGFYRHPDVHGVGHLVEQKRGHLCPPLTRLVSFRIHTL